MRLGILGGTFDPPHIGHLLAASDAFEALELDRLVFVPAGTQPLKVGQVYAAAVHRVAMLELLVEGDARFAIDRIEIERGGLSYTVETLADFERRFPSARRYFLIGGDLVSQLASWREPGRILQLAEVAVLERGAGRTAGGGNAGEDDRHGGTAEVVAGLELPRVGTRRVDVSSTEIRARVRAGLSLHGFVSHAVAAYIAAAGLYR